MRDDGDNISLDFLTIGTKSIYLQGASISKYSWKYSSKQIGANGLKLSLCLTLELRTSLLQRTLHSSKYSYSQELVGQFLNAPQTPRILFSSRIKRLLRPSHAYRQINELCNYFPFYYINCTVNQTSRVTLANVSR